MKQLFNLDLEVRKIWSMKNNNRIRRVGKRVFMGKQQALINDRNWLILQLRQAWQNKKSITGPVHIQLKFYFKDFYTKKGEMNLKLGDLDNLFCLPLDALQAAGVIQNDALVMSLDGSRKLPSDKNFLSISIFEFTL